MLGSGLPTLFSAAVSPTSTEFTREVSHPGAQTNKSDASADSATSASVDNLYVFLPIIKRLKRFEIRNKTDAPENGRGYALNLLFFQFLSLKFALCHFFFE